MKHWIALFLPLFLVVDAACAAEYALDLGLTDKGLSEYKYQPNRAGMNHSKLMYQGQRRSYYYHLPGTVRRDTPVLLALHGAGRDGASMLDSWQHSAERHGFVVVAPDGVRGNWHFAQDDTGLFDAILADLFSKHGFKSEQLFLFGHSNGAIKAITTAVSHPQKYRRVAVHAGTIQLNFPNSYRLDAAADSSVSLLLGDSDHIFSVDSARKTTRALQQLGFVSDLYILRDHTHWYYADAQRINEQAWALMTNY